MKKRLFAALLWLWGGLLAGCVSQTHVEVTSTPREVTPQPASIAPTNTSPSPARLTPTSPPTTKEVTPTLNTVATLTPASPLATPVKPTETLTPTSTPTLMPTLSPPTVTPVTANIEAAAINPAIDGSQLFRQQCGHCHQLEVVGTKGVLGPTHNHMAATAAARLQSADYAGAATTPADYIRESIVNPGIYLVSGYNLPSQKMPAFTNLSEAQVEALVQFLLAQK